MPNPLRQLLPRLLQLSLQLLNGTGITDAITASASLAIRTHQSGGLNSTQAGAAHPA
ncbi:MAG: hypothetical protein HY820_15725 [Acidobacteria bacterium]|nr:hypothetical protein [Acidobacteriota bacterium]